MLANLLRLPQPFVKLGFSIKLSNRLTLSFGR